MILLNQIIFQKQCILFGIYHEIFNIPNLLHQNPRLVAIVLLIEIGRNPALQVLCLADIDNRPLLIKVLIASGLFRDNR